MSETKRLARVARAIEDEICFQRNGYMPVTNGVDPIPFVLAIAEAAILAADGETASLKRLRAKRDDNLARLLDLSGPTGSGQDAASFRGVS